MQINNKIKEIDKNYMLNYFNKIENTIDTMNNLQLIETINHLTKEYSMLGSIHLEDNSNKTNNMDQLEILFLNDRKNELKNRINLLIVKNPEWDEFLQPVLKELSYNNTSIEYINEKIDLLNELEYSEQEPHNYKQEVNNLCLYLKSEIESGSIDLGEQNNILIELINENLLIVQQNITNVNWKDQLDILNNKCEQIYMLNKKLNTCVS